METKFRPAIVKLKTLVYPRAFTVYTHIISHLLLPLQLSAGIGFIKIIDFNKQAVNKKE